MEKVFLNNFTKITDEKFAVGYYHGMPFDPMHGLGKTEEELIKMGGAVVDNFDTQQIAPEGKALARFYNPITNVGFIEFIDMPVRELTPFELLQRENENLKSQNAEIIYNLVLNGLI